MHCTRIGNELNQLKQVYYTNNVRLYTCICNCKCTHWTNRLVLLYMYINVHWAKGFEIFSNSKYVFYIIFFLYNSRLAQIKRLSTPKICLYDLHVHHINIFKIISCTLFVLNSKCQNHCVIFSEKTARFPTEIFGWKMIVYRDSEIRQLN